MPRYTDFELPVEICGVKFRNPFFVASGPTTMTIEQLEKIRDCGWGGASLKLTVHPLPYINRHPRYGYYPDRSFFAFTAEKRLLLDELLKLIEEGRRKTPELVLFANITYAGEDGPAGWAEMARRCQDAGATVIELNMCCPNMSFNVELTGADTGGPKTGASMGSNQDVASQVIAEVRKAIEIPLFVKLTPEGGKIGPIAKKAFEAGADVVGGAANRLGVPPINLDNPTASMYYLQKEIGMACLTGKWLKPLALRDVYEMRKSVGPERLLTGVGGISEWSDAVEMVMCGADLLGICTETLLRGFGFMPELIHHFKKYMNDKGYSSIREMRDILVPAITSAPDLTIYDGHARLRGPARPTAPCVYHCPNSVPAQGYVRRVAEERFEEAYQLIMSRSPLQSVCGRVCDHPCEQECTRGLKDEPVMIRAIKRFVLEEAGRRRWRPVNLDRRAPARDEKVAVIGAGPAGIACAWDLARAGYRVTVFEAAPKPGGMLRYALPSFRLDDGVLDHEIGLLGELGVEIRTGKALGRDFTLESLEEEGYRSVFLGIGAQKGWKLEIPGEEEAGRSCLSALDFLGAARGGEKKAPGRRVAVIGGGFTALDAARTARRLGAEEVFILYRRTRDEMPAVSEEVSEAEEEGVRIMYLVAPVEIKPLSGPDGKPVPGKIAGLRMRNLVLEYETDSSGRRRPREVAGTEFDLPVDLVICALGQGIESRDLPAGADGRLEADRETGATPLPGVFAGGDCVTGPKNVIGAIAAGKRAAASIDRKLAGESAFLEYPAPEKEIDRDAVLRRHGDRERARRPEEPRRPAAERLLDFEDCARTLTAGEAVAEAGRCLACGCGAGCEICLNLCKKFSFSLDDEGRLVLDEDKCVACGMCLNMCPNNALEMIQTSDKPI